MAQSQDSRNIPSSIATSLEHLSNRPGVVATLILSRKDGSIIRATGVLQQKASEPNTDNEVADDTALPEDASSQGQVAPSSATESTKPEPTPLETFAASVVAFVASATSMSDSLRPSLLGDSTRDNAYRLLNGNGADAGHVGSATEDTPQLGHEVSDVQLLRMRTKRHEVVIFPDNKFLSCVVQEVGKNIQNADTASRP